MLKQITEDVRAVRERDPAARSTAEVLLCYSGLHATIAHRINHRLWRAGFRLAARFNSQVAKFFTGVEIHPGARIGRRFFIDHGTGTVIGETTEVGDGCSLLQGVTLGGTGKETGKRHPTLCDDVTVGAHAQVLGSITIGRGAVIGAAAVVVDPVPEYCTVVGQKATVIRRKGRRVYDFRHDQIVRRAQEPLARIEARLAEIEDRLGLQPDTEDDQVLPSASPNADPTSASDDRQTEIVNSVEQGQNQAD
ncbi:MAG: serine O-acetyltransferase [candidate division WS1 bacterium]|nr:serine O-acetyltransferase [candidate division WS1 bacterium]